VEIGEVDKEELAEGYRRTRERSRKIAEETINAASEVILRSW